MKNEHKEDLGLGADLQTWMRQLNRRRALKLLAGATLMPLVAWGEEGVDLSGDGETTDSNTTGGCAKIPEETAGPYPGDGSNGANALELSGIVRSDIRSSIAGATGVAQGVLLTVNLTVVNVNNGCSPLAGHAVYLWQCDRSGLYSMYNVAQENYLRGVQETDSNGRVAFTSIFPGCYSGRWPHIHFEVYPSLAVATSSTEKIATSQLAFPKGICDEVYATSGYSGSVSNLAQTSLSSDMVFRGNTQQLATVTGDAQNGLVANLTVGITG